MITLKKQLHFDTALTCYIVEMNRLSNGKNTTYVFFRFCQKNVHVGITKNQYFASGEINMSVFRFFL